MTHPLKIELQKWLDAVAADDATILELHRKRAAAESEANGFAEHRAAARAECDRLRTEIVLNDTKANRGELARAEALHEELGIGIRRTSGDVEAIRGAIVKVEKQRDEHQRHADRVTARLAVLAAGLVEETSLDLARRLGLALKYHRKLARLAMSAATAANSGSLTEPILGASNEATPHTRAIDALLHPPTSETDTALLPSDMLDVAIATSPEAQ